MKNKFKRLVLLAFSAIIANIASAQNVSLNMIVQNAGIIPLGGTGTLQATVNATPGTAGQTSPVATGKVNVQITVPPSLLISSTQNNIPSGWTVRNNTGSVINLCNNATTIAVNTAVDLLIELQGVTATTGSPTISGQISFRTNCSAPGSLSGDNPSDNTGQAGFTVTGTVPVALIDFSAKITNCKLTLTWTTASEINSSRYEIERAKGAATRWEKVGTVISVNDIRGRKYHFYDSSATEPDVKLFYRLKIIDQNAAHTYSFILPVTNSCKKINVFAFPNPVQNKKLFVGVTGITNNINASLYSLAGQSIKNIQLMNGTNTVDLSGIARGMYFLYVYFDNGEVRQQQVMIQ